MIPLIHRSSPILIKNPFNLVPGEGESFYPLLSPNSLVEVQVDS